MQQFRRENDRGKESERFWCKLLFCFILMRFSMGLFCSQTQKYPKIIFSLPILLWEHFKITRNNQTVHQVQTQVEMRVQLLCGFIPLFFFFFYFSVYTAQYSFHWPLYCYLLEGRLTFIPTQSMPQIHLLSGFHIFNVCFINSLH